MRIIDIVLHCKNNNNNNHNINNNNNNNKVINVKK